MTKRPRSHSLIVWAWFGLIVLISTAVYVVLGMRGHQVLWLDNLHGLPILFVGALIASRRPGHPIGYLLLVSGSAYTLPWFPVMTTVPSDPAAIGPGWSWFTLVGTLMFLAQLFPILFLLLLFPSGRVMAPRWRWVSVYGSVVALLIATYLIVQPDLQVGETSVPNPLTPLSGVPAEAIRASGDTVEAVIVGLLALFVLACISAPFARYRSAGPTERAQIRWLLYAGVLLLSTLTVLIVVGLEQAGPLQWTLVSFGLLSVAIAIAIAILRHRLFDIDVIIRRTLQYGVLTGILAGLYFGSVLLFQTLLGGLMGRTDSPPVVIVTTLALAALFNPLRLRVQRFIDRRFYRKKVDAERALARFAALARDEVDLMEIRRALFDTLGETLHPERMGLWLRPTPTDRTPGGVR